MQPLRFIEKSAIIWSYLNPARLKKQKEHYTRVLEDENDFYKKEENGEGTSQKTEEHESDKIGSTKVMTYLENQELCLSLNSKISEKGNKFRLEAHGSYAVVYIVLLLICSGEALNVLENGYLNLKHIFCNIRNIWLEQIGEQIFYKNCDKIHLI